MHGLRAPDVCDRIRRASLTSAPLVFYTPLSTSIPRPILTPRLEHVRVPTASFARTSAAEAGGGKNVVSDKVLATSIIAYVADRPCGIVDRCVGAEANVARSIFSWKRKRRRNWSNLTGKLKTGGRSDCCTDFPSLYRKFRKTVIVIVELFVRPLHLLYPIGTPTHRQLEGVSTRCELFTNFVSILIYYYDVPYLYYIISYREASCSSYLTLCQQRNYFRN